MYAPIQTARLLDVSIDGLKCIQHGSIRFDHSVKRSDLSSLQEVNLAGLFGPNGTGKTAFFDALWIVWTLLSSPDEAQMTVLKNRIGDWMNQETSLLRISCRFWIAPEDENIKPFLAEYRVCFQREFQNVFLQSEEIWLETDAERLHQKTQPDVRLERSQHFSEEPGIGEPYYRDTINFDKSAVIDWIRTVHAKGRFNPLISMLDTESLNTALTNNIEMKELRNRIRCLQSFAASSLLLADCEDLSSLENALAFLAKARKDGIRNRNLLLEIPFSHPLSIILDRQIPELRKQMETFNKYLKAVTEDVQLELHLDEQETMIREVLADPWTELRYSCIAVRGKTRLPLYKESASLKRLIALGLLFSELYSRRDLVILIDNLDCGLFEYLTGLIIDSLQDRINGQLIFSAHCLRALERLYTDQVFFTTSNPKNRFEELMVSDGNKRSEYLRNLVLGKETGEDLCSLGTQAAISIALKRTAMTLRERKDLKDAYRL